MVSYEVTTEIYLYFHKVAIISPGLYINPNSKIIFLLTKKKILFNIYYRFDKAK